MKLNTNKNFVGPETLGEKVEVFVATQSSDGEYGTGVTYSSLGDFWADFRPDQADRVLNEASLTFNRSAIFYFRFGVPINDRCQIEVDDVRYTVHSVTDMGYRHQYLEVIAYSDKLVQ